LGRDLLENVNEHHERARGDARCAGGGRGRKGNTNKKKIWKKTQTEKERGRSG
jgi:hypothetical protein